jgi:hypothetical protein
MIAHAKVLRNAVLLVLASAASHVALAQPVYAPPPGYPPPQPPPGYYAQPVYGQPPPPPPERARGRIELTGFAGYQVSTDAGTCCGTIRIDGSVDFGAALAYEIRRGYSIELLWVYVPTKLRFDSNGLVLPSSAEKSDLNLNYIQIGGVYGIKRGRLEPFFTVTAGVIIVSPATNRLTDGSTLSPSTNVKFAFTAGGGLKIWINDMFAIRAEIRALVPVYFTGTSFFVGTGGAGVGVSGGIPFAQFDFTGGLTVAL